MDLNNYENVPTHLQTHGYFCCWRYENCADRMTKVPYQPFSDYRAQSNKPNTFSSFSRAVDCATKDLCDGVGLGIFNNICAIDIDNCVSKDGVISDVAIDIIETMQSYTEFSPSGAGIHILFEIKDFRFDKDRFYIMNRQKGIEVYVAGSTNKYVTVTGNKIGNFDYGERTENLKRVLDKYMQRSQEQIIAVNGVNAVNGDNVVINNTNDEILQRAFTYKNGEKFRKLWEGNYNEYPSQSEADMALCGMLAFWTNNDPKKMDELFRQSRLMRPKWDRQQSGTTYGAITIQKALKTNFVDATQEVAAKQDSDEFLPLAELSSSDNKLPEFPVGALPPVISQYVSAVAVNTQTAVDMAATFAVGVLAVCLQGKYRIKGSPGYYEPLNLYTVVIADPGERKSGVMNMVTGCLYEYEKEYNARHAKEVRHNQQERDRLERQIYFYEEKLKEEENEADEIKLCNLQEQLAEMPTLKPLRLFTDDFSNEALSTLIANNNGKFAVISTEGGVFDIIAGRYTSKPNFDVWLKGHAGDPIITDRMGRASEMVEHPHLSAILAIQPSVLEEIMSNKKMSGRGLIARFLFSSPPTKIGNRKFGAPNVPDKISHEYRTLINRLLEIPQDIEPITLSLSQEATTIMETYFDEHEKFLIGEGQAILEWASKYIGAVLRIAGLIHVANETGTNIVSADTMQKAISIGKYFLAHSSYAYSLIGTDKTLKQAKYILSKIEAKKTKRIKLWDLAKACRSKLFNGPEDMEPALQLLQKNGYIKKELPEERKGPGRKSGVEIVVNPAFLEK